MKKKPTASEIEQASERLARDVVKTMNLPPECQEMLCWEIEKALKEAFDVWFDVIPYKPAKEVKK